MKRIQVLVLAIVLVSIFYFDIHVNAASPSLQINEVYYDTAGTDSEQEWIEIYNPTDLSIDLSGHYLKSNETTKYSILSGSINPKSYFVIARNTTGFHNLYDKDPDLGDMSIGFANSGDYVALFDSLDVQIDAVVWGNATYAGTSAIATGDTGDSIERKTLGVDTDDCLVDFVHTPAPSPFAKYERPTYSDLLEVSEILPYPADQSREEFIEIHNAGDAAIDLSGWVVDDAEGGSSGYVIPSGVQIQAKGYLAFYHSLTGIFLNNDSDSARLLDPNSVIKSSAIYDKGKKDLSYGSFEGIWKWTGQPTPGSENQYKEDIASSSSSSDSLANTSKNSNIVTVGGTVTAWPGVLSDQVFYLQADSQGYEIYNYHGEFPEIKNGDVVEVSGTPSTTGRIKTESSSNVILKSSDQVIGPRIISIGDVGQSNLDLYVEVRGRISKTSGDTFYLEDQVSGASVKVILREAAGIDKPPMQVGDYFTVAGIVSVYKNEYRILPFRAEDVTIFTSDYLATGYLPVAGGDERLLLTVSFILFAIWNLFLIRKKKQKSLLAALPRW